MLQVVYWNLKVLFRVSSSCNHAPMSLSKPVGLKRGGTDVFRNNCACAGVGTHLPRLQPCSIPLELQQVIEPGRCFSDCAITWAIFLTRPCRPTIFQQEGYFSHNFARFPNRRCVVRGIFCLREVLSGMLWHLTRLFAKQQWLKENNVPAMYGVDTRALTKKLRVHGA